MKNLSSRTFLSLILITFFFFPISVYSGQIFEDDFNDGVIDPTWQQVGGTWGESGGFMTGSWPLVSAQTDQGNLLLNSSITLPDNYYAEFSFYPDQQAGTPKLVAYNSAGNVYHFGWAYDLRGARVTQRINGARYITLVDWRPLPSDATFSCDPCYAGLGRSGSVFTMYMKDDSGVKHELLSFDDTTWGGVHRLGMAVYGTVKYESFSLYSKSVPIELGEFYLYPLKELQKLAEEYENEGEFPEEIKTEITEHLLYSIFGFASGGHPVMDVASLATDVAFHLDDEVTLFQQACAYREHSSSVYNFFPLVLVHLKGGYERYFTRTEYEGELYDPPIFKLNISFENPEARFKNKGYYEYSSTVSDQLAAFDKLTEGNIYAMVVKPTSLKEYSEMSLTQDEGNADNSPSIDVLVTKKFKTQFAPFFGYGILPSLQEWINSSLLVKGEKCSFDSISSSFDGSLDVQDPRNATLNGVLENTLDSDVYRFDAVSGETIDIEVIGKSLHTLNMYLVYDMDVYEGEATSIKANNEDDKDILSYEADETGQYYLVLSSKDKNDVWQCVFRPLVKCDTPWEYKLRLKVGTSKGKK